MIKNKKFRIALILGLLAVVAIAYLDVKSATSGVFGSYNSYTNGDFTDGWGSLFKIFVIFTFAITPIVYYFLVHADKSEIIAIYLVSYISWIFGLADAFYFFLQKQLVPSTLPWLNNHFIIGKIAYLTGGVVTNITLYISIIIGLTLSYLLASWLEKVN